MSALAAPTLLPFTLAALVMGGLVLVEALSLAIGHSASGVLDTLLDHEAGPGLAPATEGGVSPSEWLSWINVGRVPFLILLILALAGFAVAGFLLQGIAGAVLAPLPGPVAALLAGVAMLPVLRVSSRLLARVIPRDETYVVTADDLVGSVAEVTLGPLDAGLPGQVRVVDLHGNTHFLRARAAEGAPAMRTGQRVLLVDRAEAVFAAVPAAPEL